ncbi:MAG: signal recognition particle-docking protein FtsY [Candidatus Dependentiae bacterium]|nr:signal recognition particle-docking protein FtsY [Candidatus Dependentiae bacterium]
MFGFIKKVLHKIYTGMSSRLSAIFSRSNIDENALKEVERILIEADAGVPFTKELTKKIAARGLIDGHGLRTVLRDELCALVERYTYAGDTDVYLLVGVNGSGKTTAAGKLAHRLVREGKRVLLVAGDTFRAAAVEQLKVWGERVGAPVHTGQPGQDTASVIFSACERFEKENFDALIIDTAGRLQAKANLMRELEKIGRVISKKLPTRQVTTLLVIDAMLGQNSLDQARLFNENTKLNGVILTKLDGTAKGGIIFAIAYELGIPVAYLSYGEQPENLYAFKVHAFLDDLLTT